ncbi:DUF1830 domain-containing protein [Lyngbya sp. CCY1209]|uniref:DUF1830 domain-containing protein n=1 Tax=Lyngbya sp. CCY1209 TaxID=2886103 RepID=UPI002D207AAE|nr:DUF1830 domain-containing protein [Lyngbya sp. CCY1209]MEB3884466.1 DUF1830 domain-containing protein [Lyngbya sp. CCY1209]
MISSDRPKISSPTQVLCSYQNRTSTIEILRMDDPGCDPFERIVFPGQIFLFEATGESHLKIFYAVSSEAIEMRRISCRTLQVDEGV